MAVPIQSTASYPRALMEGVKLWWGDAAKGTPEYWSLMYKKVDSDKNYEEYVQEITLGLAQMKPEGAPVAFDSPQQGFMSRVQNVAWALGIMVTHEELKDNLYAQLTEKRTRMLRRAFSETKNINAAISYNNAFNSAYSGADGASLIATAHPNFTGGTWSNTFATPAEFSQYALEDMLILMALSQNDRGYIEPLSAERLILHPNNLFNAEVVLKTAKVVGSNANDINPIEAQKMVKEGFIANPYLTSTGAWFIRTNAEDGMIWQEREALEFWEDNDSSTRNLQIAAYERYAFAFANPRGVFGVNAA